MKEKSDVNGNTDGILEMCVNAIRNEANAFLQLTFLMCSRS